MVGDDKYPAFFLNHCAVTAGCRSDSSLAMGDAQGNVFFLKLSVDEKFWWVEGAEGADSDHMHGRPVKFRVIRIRGWVSRLSWSNSARESER